MSKNTSSILQTKKQFGTKEGDLITLLNLFKVFAKLGRENQKRFCFDYNLNLKSFLYAESLVQKLTDLTTYFGFRLASSDDDVENIMRCFITGFFLNVAKRNPDGSYSPLSELRKRGSQRRLKLHLEAGSILQVDFPVYVVYYKVYETARGDRYMTNVSEIFPEWLIELLPEYFSDYSKEMVEKRREEDIRRAEQDEPALQMKTETEQGLQKPAKVEFKFLRKRGQPGRTVHKKCFKGTEKIGKTRIKIKKRKNLISDLMDEEDSD